MYTFEKIKNIDYIGNSLEKINTNYENLDDWTSNILLSSEKYFDPLKNFYLNFGDFWKESINYSNEIEAIPRLTSFETTVLENTAKWINPMIFYYPILTSLEAENIQNLKQNAIEWINDKFPAEENGSAIFVQNTVAYIYCFLYNEELRIDTTYTKISSTNCKTNDSSSTVNCWIHYLNIIGCYGDRNVCANFSRTKATHPNNPTCENIFSVKCEYENGGKEVEREGIVNINSYFSDRYESEFYVIKMIVDECKWVELI